MKRPTGLKTRERERDEEENRHTESHSHCLMEQQSRRKWWQSARPNNLSRKCLNRFLGKISFTWKYYDTLIGLVGARNALLFVYALKVHAIPIQVTSLKSSNGRSNDSHTVQNESKLVIFFWILFLFICILIMNKYVFIRLFFLIIPSKKCVSIKSKQQHHVVWSHVVYLFFFFTKIRCNRDL